MGDDRKPTFSELDRRRREGRGAAPQGKRARERAERDRRGALQAAEQLFSGAPGGEEGRALAQAVRDAHGTARLEEACRAYLDAVGPPGDVELLGVFLDVAAKDVRMAALEQLESLQAKGRLEMKSGLRTQLRALAEDPDDDVAGTAEDLLG